MGVNVPDAILVGRFSGDNHWPGFWVIAEGSATVGRWLSWIPGERGLDFFLTAVTFPNHDVRRNYLGLCNEISDLLRFIPSENPPP